MTQKEHSQISNNTPQPSHKITQLELVDNISIGNRAYTSASSITDASIDKFRRTGKGLTYIDLMNAGVAIHKRQAQETLKYHLRRSNLFSLVYRRPQQYYPTKFRSEIIEK